MGDSDGPVSIVFVEGGSFKQEESGPSEEKVPRRAKESNRKHAVAVVYFFRSAIRTSSSATMRAFVSDIS